MAKAQQGVGRIAGFLHAVLRELEERRSIAAVLVFFLDAAFTAIIVKNIRYPYSFLADTEIDWVAYMEEVAGVMGGEFDYSKLKGQTGPLVYPAGFVWVFAVLRELTDQGQNIAKAQMIFFGIYLLNQAVVLWLYCRARLVPAWAMVLLALSKRVHSLFVLRMFNDAVAMLLLHIALLLFSYRRWGLGCSLFSLAVSVKMNVLLFAPPLLYLLLASTGIQGAVIHVAWCAVIQVLVALPFLVRYPLEYIRGAFDLGRVFLHRWSVNLKFLPEPVFVSKPLALGLLATHLAVLALFFRCFLRNPLRLFAAKRHAMANSRPFTDVITPRFIVLLMFVGNFVGIAFARSLHFQFYSWYFHAIPALLWGCKLTLGVRLGLFVMVEAAFNITDPSGCHSEPKGADCGSPMPKGAILLCFAHLVMLLGLFNPSTFPHNDSSEKEKTQ